VGDLLPSSSIRVPSFLPERVRVALSGRRFTVAVPRMARRAIKSAERILPSVWNEKHRRVPLGESNPGPWRREYAPHAPFILDLAARPWVREVWYCGPERDGKTNILLGFIAWAIDQMPGGIYYLMPSEVKALQIVTEKIIPMIENSPRLASLLGNRRVDVKQTLIKLLNGVRIFPAHARSATSLASFSALIGVGDEVDKYDLTVGGEASPIALLKKRLREFRHRSKLLLASTPAGKFIFTGASACQVVYVTDLQCPHCDAYHRAGEEGLILPEGATAETLNSGEHVAAQACPECGALWTEADLDAARRAYRMTAIKGADVARPETVGILRTAWDCHLITLREIAIAKVRADHGGLAEKRDYAHGYKCEDYKRETESQREADHLLSYRSEHARNVVPSDTARLGLLVDTQQDHFYYEVWAYGYKPRISMHMVRHGIVQAFADLEGLLEEDFETVDDKVMQISVGLIDSGGTRRGWQKHSRTLEVYEWCVKNRRMIPLKGVFSSADGAPITYKTVEVLPGTGRKIKGGLIRANIIVDLFKDHLAATLAIEPDDPGALSFHSDIDAAFSKHYSSEVKNEDGKWEHIKKLGRNDYFDCNVYAIALRKILETRIGKKPAEKKDKKTFIVNEGVSIDG